MNLISDADQNLILSNIHDLLVNYSTQQILTIVGMILVSHSINIAYGKLPYYRTDDLNAGCPLAFKLPPCDESWFHNEFDVILGVSATGLIFSGIFALIVWLITKDKAIRGKLNEQ
jgi:hypothetical protein